MFFFRRDKQDRQVHTRLEAARHCHQLEENRSAYTQDYINNSLLGLVSVYNLLPSWIVEKEFTVSGFQGALQALVKE